MMTTPPQTHSDVPNSRRGRWILIGLSLVFALPLLTSYVLYFSDWRPSGKSVHFGELVQPARPLPELTLTSPAGDPVALSSLRHQWLLLYVGHSGCEAGCEKALDSMHRVRLATGKEMRRIEHAFIVVDGDRKQWEKLAMNHPGLRILAVEAKQQHALLTALAGNDQRKTSPGKHIFLVDPIGNLVLRYGAQDDATGIRKDLARLLRLSQVG